MNWWRCGKFGTEQKITRLECDTHKNVRSNRVKQCNEQRENWEQWKTCSKSSVVVALCLLPTEKWIWKNCWFLNVIVSKKCCESCSQWSVHCKTWNKKSLMKAGERERQALMTADVWVYNSTVYNEKGTTWSGSQLWK
jgi:hypothetical protein